MPSPLLYLPDFPHAVQSLPSPNYQSRVGPYLFLTCARRCSGRGSQNRPSYMEKRIAPRQGEGKEGGMTSERHDDLQLVHHKLGIIIQD
jgi:hypothetical protein